MARHAGWLWGLVPVALVWASANVLHTESIRRDIEARALAASAVAGAASGARGVSVRISGRDVYLDGEAVTSDGANKALAQLQSEFGVRRVLGGLTQVIAQRPYSWSAARQGGLVTLSGFVPDEATASALLGAARALRPGLRIDDQQKIAFGAPVGFDIALREPDLVAGLIIQNANAHRTGFGPAWKDTLDYWSNPNPENEAAATAHLTFDGTRDQYVAGVPADIVARIKGEPWVEDWKVMCLPGRMETQRALIADYPRYAARFDEIADYLAARQPPALMIWGRHDAFFDIAETLSWIEDLPRMEAHILDGGHFLLETHAEPALALMTDFIRRN